MAATRTLTDHDLLTMQRRGARIVEACNGAPMGNQNAAGQHHLEYADLKRIGDKHGFTVLGHSNVHVNTTHPSFPQHDVSGFSKELRDNGETRDIRTWRSAEAYRGQNEPEGADKLPHSVVTTTSGKTRALKRNGTIFK